MASASKKALIGVLLDVSGSMREQLSFGSDSRADSAVNAITKIIKEESKANQESEIFVGAFGIESETYQTIDLLAAVIDAGSQGEDASEETCRQILEEIKNNGASYIFEYVRIPDARSCISESSASLLLAAMKKNPSLTRKFASTLPVFVQTPSNPLTAIVNLGASKVLDHATPEIVRQHTKELERIFKNEGEFLSKYSRIKPMPLADISSSLKDTDFAKKFRENKEVLESYIYGGTPMCDALRKVTGLFEHSTNTRKHLVIISDGKPTDGDPREIVRQIKANGVTVSTLLLAPKESNILCPRAFFDKACDTWNEPVTLMFELSSEVPNQNMPRALLAARGWSLPQSGSCKLFIQANNPDIINEVSNFSIALKSNVDALIDVVGQIELDVILNANWEALEAEKREPQKKKTCYAHAVATILYLASRRIVGYEPSRELKAVISKDLSFKSILKAIIKEFGEDGAYIENVLEKYCKLFRLHMKEVNENRAKEALNKQRPLVATFYLEGNQWNEFSSFWDKDKKKVMTAMIPPGIHDEDSGGHAVSLISYDSSSLRFLNSWGWEWADGGFFRIKNAGVLGMTFFDVFFYESDLTENEKEAWKQHASEIAKDINKMFPYSSKTLKYICPCCEMESSLKDFGGDFVEAECSKCLQRFKPAAGNLEILRALYYRDN